MKYLVLVILLTCHTLACGKAPQKIYQEADPACVSFAVIGDGNEWTGSGFFLTTPSGTKLVTAGHVVRGADIVVIHRHTGRAYQGKTVKATKVPDLAVLVADPDEPGLKPSKRIPVPGDTCYVLGAPLGLPDTFSAGIVSTYRVIDGNIYIQITAPISPGSSGSPLLDSDGHVVGIVVAAAGGEGLGLAVPIAKLEELEKLP